VLVLNIHKKLLKKLGVLPLEGISCDIWVENNEQLRALEEAFNIKTKIPDYLTNSRTVYEVGEGEWKGMKITIYGPSRPNPNYEPPPKEEIENEMLQAQLTSPIIAELFWKAIVKGWITLDTDKMKALFKAEGLDWEWHYGAALKLWG